MSKLRAQHILLLVLLSRCFRRRRKIGIPTFIIVIMSPGFFSLFVLWSNSGCGASTACHFVVRAGDEAGNTDYEIQVDDNQTFFSPASDGDNFGSWSLTREVIVGKPAGGVNGDGYSDVVVGAYLAEAGGTARGAAYVFLGGSAMDTATDGTINDDENNDSAGFCVSNAGDLNGGASMDNTVDTTLSGAGSADRFGYSVSGGR